MFDPRHVGHSFEPFDVEVERGALRLFAKAIGESDPIYCDEAAAKAAGFRSVVAPPTYVSALLGLSPTYFPAARLLGFDEGQALHAEQAFEYFAPICAGDCLTLRGKIVDIFEKKGGALNFVVTETEVYDRAGQLVARASETLVIRGD
ncbi:MAG: MaoC family dehydratase [Rhizobiales bacterium]|nr:MaoC family dehydratase [Hyphomicrobiales bacterium]